jgi:hypothetical protein
MDHTNPAFRLLSILESGRSQDANTACRTIWASILKTNENSPELLIRLGKAMELPQLIVQALQDLYPEEPNTWEHWSSQVRNAFMQQQLHGPWRTFISNIDSHSYTYLRMHAKLLQLQSKTNPLKNEVLEETRLSLNECLTKLLQADIDQDVKTYIARNLRRLIAAIDEYHITGTTGVFDSIEILMGHQVFDPKYKAYIQESDLGKQISTTVGTIADAMSIVLGLPQIGGSINALIGKSV